MKVLWSLEPFHQNSLSLKGMHDLLRQLVGSLANIEIGFIVTRSEPELYLAYDIPQKARYTTYPRKLLKDVLQKAKITIDDKNLHVIDFDTTSNTAAVDRLLAVTKSRSADLIALYTHARKGFRRFMLGSFAETIIHRSKTNLLLINPLAKPPEKIRRIIFAADFSQSTKKALQQSLEICQKLKADLTVFHVAEIIYEWSLDETDSQIHSYRKKVRRTCEWIEKECKTFNVPCEVIVSTEIKPITDLVLNAANKAKADMIIVVAKVGPLAALMGGSITRQLIRSSTKPILVLK